MHKTIDTKRGLFYNAVDFYFVYLLTDIHKMSYKREASMASEHSANKIGKTVGERLRAARIAQKYTQGKLAAPNFSVSYISAIERGQIRPSLRALEILATRLGLASTELLPTHPQQDGQSAPLVHPERDEDDTDLIFTEIQALLWQDEPTKALELLNKYPLKKLKRPHQLLHQYLLGWAHFLQGLLQESGYILEQAATIVLELHEQYLSLRILNLQGIIYADLHNYPQALLHHQRCLNLLESIEPQNSLFIIEVCMYIGQHHAHMDTIEDALSMYEKALALSEQLSPTQKLQLFCLEQSQYHSKNKALEIAALYAHKALYLYREDGRKQQRSNLQHYLGRALVKSDPQQAEAYLNNALQQTTTQQDPLTHASILIHKAQLSFARDQLQEAAQFAQQACEFTSPYTHSIITPDVLLTLGRINYAQAHYDEGDRHFVQGLELLEQGGTSEEVSEQLVQYAQLLEQRGMAREAFTYLRHAFQYR